MSEQLCGHDHGHDHGHGYSYGERYGCSCCSVRQPDGYGHGHGASAYRWTGAIL
ncbi:MAG: hypothetical protein M3N09_07995 [Actinomycetota bacterium]|nr:hypothetical protein [Actinomycetota bacterium]